MILSVSSPALRSFRRLGCLLGACLALGGASVAVGFEVNTTPQPANHHPIVPEEGAKVTLNPPSMVWRDDARAASYIVELSQDASFPQETGLIRKEGVTFPFYNHNEVLKQGTWYWRYFVMRKDGEISRPSPVRSFIVTGQSQPFPAPSPEQVLANLPAHPRIFVTPETLEEIRARRNGEGKQAWESLRFFADRALNNPFATRGPRIPIAEAQIVPSAESIGHSDYKAGQLVRRQVFYQDANGDLFWLPDYRINFLVSDAAQLETLSFAWQLSQDERYLQAARKLMAVLAPLRLDAHLSDNDRAVHDTVVYAYEEGLKSVALAYDRLYDALSNEEKANILAHIEYHAQAAGNWLKKVNIHTVYQLSHPQRCMHQLLITTLATAGDSEIMNEWLAYLIPQYMNRLDSISEDGGSYEGPAYAYRLGPVLEVLLAINTATGVDLAAKPEIRNAGVYWLYATDMNYWFYHWGDVHNLKLPHVNLRDGFTSTLLAALNSDPYLKWYALTTTSNPETSPFDYFSAGELEARPPIDIAQARAFPQTGTVVAYNGLYDHNAERIFFRSSPWGSHSHAHADQNAFVIHAGGEILAPDTGYYTYYGDDYDMKWSKSTFAHNTMLINGKPQPISIKSKGSIENFFHGSRLTYFVGDASSAYRKPLEAFRRAVLYVRPGTFVVYDELAAAAPSTYSWLLNVFEKPQIEAETKRIFVKQEQMRLQVDTLLPAAVQYSANNDLPYPLKQADKPWSRYNGAFPQPWHIRVENAAPAKEAAFLTLLQSWNIADGSRERVGATIDTATTVGLEYESDEGRATVLFRRKLNGEETITTDGNTSDTLEVNAQAAALQRSATGEMTNWFLAAGTQLQANGTSLFRSERPVHASARFDYAAAEAILYIDGAAGQTAVRLPSRPQKLLVGTAQNPQQAQELPFKWNDATSSAHFELPSDANLAIWVNPLPALTAELSAAQLAITDSKGEYVVDLQPAWTESGEVMYFGRVTPRENGTYTVRTKVGATVASENDAGITSSADSAGGSAEQTAPATSLLIQDHWNPHFGSARGQGSVSGTLREGSWLYFKAPAGAAPRFEATLDQPVAAGVIDNLLFNGDFEHGTPNYPPRDWTLSFKAAPEDSLSWFHWTQADARSGESAMRYVRDRHAYELVARPMRLQSGGEYHLRFYAKGDVDNAQIVVRGSQNRRIEVKITPSSDWQLYEARGELSPGYTSLMIVVPDGEKGQELWVDAIEFGKIPNP